MICTFENKHTQTHITIPVSVGKDMYDLIYIQLLLISHTACTLTSGSTFTKSTKGGHFSIISTRNTLSGVNGWVVEIIQALSLRITSILLVSSLLITAESLEETRVNESTQQVAISSRLWGVGSMIEFPLYSILYDNIK